ncbi:MAG TPA: TonB-dependent receptor, partial [Blastocatellia bacterium]|nr:TonB-dependent receptor [Blastocatellia bacterium]
MRESIGVSPCILIFTIISAGTVFAQGYRASIVGTVTDPSGAVIPNARITATNRETGISSSATSDEAGNYVIARIVPGIYGLRIEAAGFKSVIRKNILLQVDQTLRVDFALEIGQVTEQVMIAADGEGGNVNTETSSLGEVVTNREILDIPLNGRNYLSLALLAPGVVPAAAGANPHNINGARPDHVNYLLDGVSNINRRGNQPVVTPSIDAIREFKIITNGYSAEYGRLDAGVISVALASGTNSFHGTLFEFHRNDALDARSFFDEETPRLIRNQFGGVLGGPVVRGKTFFLVSYEGLRNREGQTRLARVPTLEERRGIFAAPIRNPFNRRPFPNNTIPAELISPVARNILAFIPEPNREGSLNFITSSVVEEDRDAFIAKIDHHIGGSDQISGRFLLNDLKAEVPFRSTAIPGFGSTRETREQHWSLSHTHIFGPSLINEARFGYIRSNFSELSVNAGKETSAEAGITGVARGSGLASIVIVGLPEVGDPTFLPDEWTDNEFVVSDMVSLVRGGHNVRFGGEFQRSQHFNHFASFAGGQIIFLGSFSTNPFADFLLGLPVQTTRQVGTNKSYLFSNYWGLFVQHDWKVRPRLTLNLGVRYDLNRPPVEKYDRWANFIVSEGRQVRAGERGFPRSLVRTDYNNIAPRLGFAYRPFGGDDTAIRGGYGIYYGFDLQFTMYQLLGATAFPFTRLEQYQAIAVGNPSLANPFPENRPPNAPGAISPNGWEFDNPSPYTQGWNLTLAHDFGSALGVEVSYVGAKGTHQSAVSNINQTIRTEQGNVVPYPGFGRVLIQGLGANSSYNALQVSIERRFNQGLGFRSSFTWSKAIDYASFAAASRVPQNSRDLRAERGLAEFDRRRTWATDFDYEIPFGRGRLFGSTSGRLIDAV